MKVVFVTLAITKKKKGILNCNLTLERIKDLSRENYYCAKSTPF